MAPSADDKTPKQWEIRAALRAFARSREGGRRNPAVLMVNAAWDLVAERDDFTVKDVTERAGVALQTFYRHFGSKDELVLAMLEESVGRGTANLAATASKFADPVERLRALVTGPILGPYDESGVRLLHWRARERQRLSQRFPHEVEAVHEPYRAALVLAIEDAGAHGRVASEQPALDGYLIQHLVLTMTHLAQGKAMDESPETVADAVWSLCWRGLRPTRDSQSPSGASARHKRSAE